ncbi:MAG TPA: ABC transporter permease [Vicinamibacterales bacterium]|jgi:peptide/nickel transport system permease protein
MRSQYLVKRTIAAVFTVFFAITLNFILFRAAPGDATDTLGRCRNCTPEFQEALRAELGLDKSVAEQYFVYLGQLAQGNLGRSFVSQEPVVDVLIPPLLNTLPMVALGAFLAITLGIIAGVIAAWRRGTAVEALVVSSGLFFYSLPMQWLGLMLIIAFAGILPTNGIADPYLALTDPSAWEVAVDRLEHLFLPALTLAIVGFGEYALITRAALIETFGEDYILTARAKGLGNTKIIRRHALRNAMLPVITLVALALGFLIAGEVLIEAVFSYPGIGLEMYRAVFARDYPVLQGAFLILTMSVILANYVADLLYFKLDPRVTA